MKDEGPKNCMGCRRAYFCWDESWYESSNYCYRDNEYFINGKWEKGEKRPSKKAKVPRKAEDKVEV